MTWGGHVLGDFRDRSVTPAGTQHELPFHYGDRKGQSHLPPQPEVSPAGTHLKRRISIRHSYKSSQGAMIKVLNADSWLNV